MDTIIPFITALLRSSNFNFDAFETEIANANICNGMYTQSQSKNVTFKIGDHIFIERFYQFPEPQITIPYTHHGIIVGLDPIQVAHAQPTKDPFTKIFRITNMDDFVGSDKGSPVEIAQYSVTNLTNFEKKSCRVGTTFSADKIDPVTIQNKAIELVNNGIPYNIFSFNCENFAYFCSTNKKKSSELVDTYCDIITKVNPMIGSIITSNTRRY